jgi:Mn-containing catalase
MTREITHMKAFTLALESLGKAPFSIGALPPTPGVVNQYFNDSTGVGQRGERDLRGPWNEGNNWQMVEAPAFRQFLSPEAGSREPGNGHASSHSGDGHGEASKKSATKKSSAKYTK